MMNLEIRAFCESDINELVEILRLNKQYDYPGIEGHEAMERVSKCDAAFFFVAQCENKVCGLVRGVYDGSRALIHLLSVHPDYKSKGIGKALVQASINEIKKRGAPSVSVTVTDQSASFWENIGFERLPVFLMLKSI